ncbi:hypothetical protein SVAN01_11862 [Stagonosporopsis vannaccii]|nr:hypothetical protein SVAN01_11862 [Stagonosporopsis vannaccii]
MAPCIIDDVLVDDSTWADPSVGLKGLQRLDERFVHRIGRLTGAKVSMQQDDSPDRLKIYLTLPNSSRTSYVAYTRKFAEDLQSVVRRIANTQHDLTKTEELEDLWEIILIYAYQVTDETTKKTQKLFEDQSVKFQSMICDMFDLDAIYTSECRFDMELGAHIVRLEQLARTYVGQIRQQDELIELAWHMVCTHAALNTRMRALLQSTFANNLHLLVCELSHAKRALHTIFRIAKSTSAFKNVSILLAQPPSRPSSISPVVRRTAKPSSPQLAAQQSPTAISPLSLPSSSLDILESVRPYLSKEDQEHGIYRLHSSAKQDTAILVAFVLRGLVPSPASNAYYRFGFVVCKDCPAQARLCSTYRRFLSRKQGKQANFRDLVQALEANKLPLLPDDDGHQHKLVMHHSVRDFLLVRPQERPSVFRLIQFLRDEDNDEPPPCVKRDYGFRLCTQREHVTALRNLYTAILSRTKTTPLELHYACEQGELLRFASKVTVVEPNMHRFLRNENNPGIGFDNDVGLGAYMLPLFKKSLKS